MKSKQWRFSRNYTMTFWVGLIMYLSEDFIFLGLACIILIIFV